MRIDCGVRYAKQALLRASQVGGTASAQSGMTSSDIATVTSSKMRSAASRTSDVSPPDDKLAANFLSGVALATAVAFWL
jgi:hypothetical protein